MLSAALHGLVAAGLLLGSYATSQNPKPAERILELVAGEGSNYGATVAPALGTPDGKSTATAVAPAPRPPPTIAQKLQRNLWRAEAKGKEAAAKEREAELKQLAREELEQKANAKTPNPVAAPPTKTPVSKLTKIDAEGIAKGVLGGSTENKVGGAGGKALTSSGGGEMERYLSLLRARLLEALDKPRGVSDTLEAEAEFWLAANGTVSRVRISKRSGSREFDDAVLAAFGRIDLPQRPDGKSEMAQVTFRTRDAEER